MSVFIANFKNEQLKKNSKSKEYTHAYLVTWDSKRYGKIMTSGGFSGSYELAQKAANAVVARLEGCESQIEIVEVEK